MSDIGCLFCHEHLSAIVQFFLWARDVFISIGGFRSRHV